MKILQFGTTGQVARELLRQAPAWPVEITAISRAQCDFNDAQHVARVISGRKPDLIVNAAAYTAVDQAEADVASAFEVNAQSPARIAGLCGADGAAMVHFSTDYVFDGGKGTPYLETDRPEPLSVYGRSKLSGEQLVLAACPRALVHRNNWVVTPPGRTIVRTKRRLAAEGQPLRVVDDQFGRPTSAADLAGFVLANAERLAGA
ncbi:MAG: dTDP-4-dehydrorhamnose reductase, partial [Phenylobacterium sp.]|nr:dTDP-4-dehydrorhamnose reductase [Phenylobacterium sp.]